MNSEKKPILSEPVVSSQPYPHPNQQLPPPVAMVQPEFGTIQGKRVCPVEGHREWATGLFDCTQDMTNCIMVCCCGPCVLCQLASRLGEFFCFPVCIQGGTTVMRTRVRTLGGIQGTICSDCLTMTFCGACGICQLKREMDHMDIY